MSKQEVFPGLHTVAALLKYQPDRIQTLWIEQNKDNQRIQECLTVANQLGVSIQTMQRAKLDRLCEATQHQGIAASCSVTQLQDEHTILDMVNNTCPPLLLILDEVSDPHNLGACLRTADAAGVDAVIMPQRHAAPLSPTVHKIASGATVTLKIHRTPNLARCIDNLKKVGIWIYGADGSAQKTLYAADLTVASAIVMGAEGQGLRRLTREKCDHLCALPMFGQVESLNVSVATGLFLYEAVRQRQA